MNELQQKEIYLKVIEHIDDLNELLQTNNSSVNKELFTMQLNRYVCDLNNEDLNVYISSLLVHIFSLSNERISILKNELNKLIILNYLNTVLSELNYEQIIFEVK